MQYLPCEERKKHKYNYDIYTDAIIYTMSILECCIYVCKQCSTHFYPSYKIIKKHKPTNHTSTCKYTRLFTELLVFAYLKLITNL